MMSAPTVQLSHVCLQCLFDLCVCWQISKRFLAVSMGNIWLEWGLTLSQRCWSAGWVALKSWINLFYPMWKSIYMCLANESCTSAISTPTSPHHPHLPEKKTQECFIKPGFPLLPCLFHCVLMTLRLSPAHGGAFRCWRQTSTLPGVCQTTSEEETAGATSFTGSLLYGMERVTSCTNTLFRKSVSLWLCSCLFLFLEKCCSLLKADDAHQWAATHKFPLPEPGSFTKAKPKQALPCAEVAPSAAEDPAECKAETRF